VFQWIHVEEVVLARVNDTQAGKVMHLVSMRNLGKEVQLVDCGPFPRSAAETEDACLKLRAWQADARAPEMHAQATSVSARVEEALLGYSWSRWEFHALASKHAPA
jgi:hypothetical protein